jgi:hypothetical protein
MAVLKTCDAASLGYVEEYSTIAGLSCEIKKTMNLIESLQRLQ